MGLYGKVPAHGDFVRRGLPTSFVGPWDDWLQHGMAAARERLGPRWAEAWDAAPAWRFALPAGACGPDAVAGVMLASEDMVGRRFPITLAALLPPGAPAPEEAWFATIEAAATAGRRGRADADALLAAIPCPGEAPTAALPLDDWTAPPERAEPDHGAWAAAWETVAPVPVAAPADEAGQTPLPLDPGDVLALLGDGPLTPAGDAPGPDAGDCAGLPGGFGAGNGAEDAADVLALLAGGGDRPTDPPDGAGVREALPALPGAKDLEEGRRVVEADDPWAAAAALPGGTAAEAAPSGDAGGDDTDVLALLTQTAGSHPAGNPGPAASTPDDVLALLGDAAGQSDSGAAPATPAFEHPLPLAEAPGTLAFLAGQGSSVEYGANPGRPSPIPVAPPEPAPPAPPGGGWWTRGASRVPSGVRATPYLLPATDFVSLLEADA